jgi:hypothetical protein
VSVKGEGEACALQEKGVYEREEQRLAELCTSGHHHLGRRFSAAAAAAVAWFPTAPRPRRAA